MRRRISWIFVSSLAALVAVVAIAAHGGGAPEPRQDDRGAAASRGGAAPGRAVFNDLGNLLLLGPQTAEAETAYRKAIELDPDKASALFNLGLLLQQRGELREAASSIGAR